MDLVQVQPTGIDMEITDLTGLSFDYVEGYNKIKNSNPIAVRWENGRKIYYKLPFYNTKENRFKGHETINEVIVSRFFDIVGIEHVKYSLVPSNVTYKGETVLLPVCASEDFCAENEEAINMGQLYDEDHESFETGFEFCKRKGLLDFIYPMIAADYLIMNRDRYTHNIFLLKNKTDGTIRSIPLFDHGLSLLSDCYTEEEIEKFDGMKDRFSLMFVGIWLVTKNLKLIPKDKLQVLKELKESDRPYIFEETKGWISELHENKIWELLWGRYNYYSTLFQK